MGELGGKKGKNPGNGEGWFRRRIRAVSAFVLRCSLSGEMADLQWDPICGEILLPHARRCHSLACGGTKLLAYVVRAVSESSPMTMAHRLAHIQNKRGAWQLGKCCLCNVTRRVMTRVWGRSKTHSGSWGDICGNAGAVRSIGR